MKLAFRHEGRRGFHLTLAYDGENQAQGCPYCSKLSFTNAQHRAVLRRKGAHHGVTGTASGPGTRVIPGNTRGDPSGWEWALKEVEISSERLWFASSRKASEWQCLGWNPAPV